jgi:hypothetical protein
LSRCRTVTNMSISRCHYRNDHSGRAPFRLVVCGSLIHPLSSRFVMRAVGPFSLCPFRVTRPARFIPRIPLSLCQRTTGYLNPLLYFVLRSPSHGPHDNSSSTVWRNRAVNCQVPDGHAQLPASASYRHNCPCNSAAALKCLQHAFGGVRRGVGHWLQCR